MTLAALRLVLADELTAAGIPATLNPEDAAQGSGAVVLTGDPYLEASDVFGELTVRFNVFLYVDASPRFADEADALISNAVTVLGDYDIESVGGVDAYVINATGKVLLGTQIILTTEVARKELTN